MNKREIKDAIKHIATEFKYFKQIEREMKKAEEVESLEKSKKKSFQMRKD